MKTLYICTVATSLYNNYIPYLIESLKNINFQRFNIKFIVISDKPYRRTPQISYYYPIAHFPYPFNSYLKPLILQNCFNLISAREDDYFMYVDADTIFRKGANYDLIEEDLLSDKLLFALSPWMNSRNYLFENSLNQEKYNEVWIEQFEKTDFLQCSFFGGKIREFNIFCSKFFDLTQVFTEDWREKRIPPMIDQSVITKLVYDEKQKYIKDNYIFNFYEIENGKMMMTDVCSKDFSGRSACERTFKINDYPKIFLIQKFNEYIKKPIRKSI